MKNSLSKEIEEIRTKQMELSEIKNTITEIKSPLAGIMSRKDTKERINKLKDKTIEII